MPLREAVILFGCLVVAVILHEISHGVVKPLSCGIRAVPGDRGILVCGRGGVPGTPMQLTKEFELVPPTVYYGKWALHIHPTWTRDGKDLILVSNRDNKHGSGGFYRMRAEPNATPAASRQAATISARTIGW